jgi:hypothetical protein
MDLTIHWIEAFRASTCSPRRPRYEAVEVLRASPKGLGAGYGIPQFDPNSAPFSTYVLEYLEARKVYLESKGLQVNSWPLVPSIYTGEVKEHSSNNFQDIKKKIEEYAGMDFKIKDFRSTCAQMIKDATKDRLR